jgi:hypothetical protein
VGVGTWDEHGVREDGPGVFLIGLEMFCVGEMGWSCTTTAHMLATLM